MVIKRILLCLGALSIVAAGWTIAWMSVILALAHEVERGWKSELFWIIILICLIVPMWPAYRLLSYSRELATSASPSPDIIKS
jgi:hypothetical protein